MCQFDICACAPVQSGREGPRVVVVVDRRTQPWAGGPRDRRVAIVPVLEDRRIAERNLREGHGVAAAARSVRG